MMTGPPTQTALIVSACIALCKSQPEKSGAARDDEADPARPHRYRPVPDHDWPVHISALGGTAPPRRRLPQQQQRTFSDPLAVIPRFYSGSAQRAAVALTDIIKRATRSKA